MTIPCTPVPGWEQRFPGLIAGTTGRLPGEQRPNFGLFTALPAGEAMDAWAGILEITGMRAAVHSRQVHEAEVRVHRGAPQNRGAPEKSGAAGLWVVGPGDGHATGEKGLLLTVTTADCVPVFIVGEEGTAVGLLHAGWRGAAAGVLESGIATFAEAFGVPPSDLHIHLGPAICGACYQVGAEVFRALDVPGEDGDLLDLRRVLASRARDRGVPAGHTTVSESCTKCTGSFFSHRGGDAGRQIAYLGRRS